MSSTELPADMGATKHAPIWAVGLAATLLAASFGRRRTEAAAASDQAARRFDEDTPARGARALADEGRGRAADTPSEIPAPGWKDILLRVYRQISEDRILLVAAGVTFYALLSIFPGIAALISIYGLFADPGTVANQLDTVANVAPGGAIQLLRDELTRLSARGSTTLGVGFLISLAISLWTTNSGVSAIFDAMNIVYEEREKRGLIAYYLATLTFTLGAIAFVLL